MNLSRKTRMNLLLGTLITVLFTILMGIKFLPLEVLEDKFYDYRFKIRGTVPPSQDIVIAAIDERSIGSPGRWPWNRDKISQLVE